MRIFSRKNRLRKSLSEPTDERLKRRGFNVLCTGGLAIRVRMMAAALKCPQYAVAEHLFELGLAELAVIVQDPDLKKGLEDHLLREHVLVDRVDPEARVTTQRSALIKAALQLLKDPLVIQRLEVSADRLPSRVEKILTAMRLIELWEMKGVHPNQITMALNELWNKARLQQANHKSER